MIKSISLKFRGIEPIIIIKSEKPRVKHTTEIGLFFYFYRLMFKIRHSLQYYKFKRSKINPIQCEGCGEGWATYEIDEPNGENYSIYCCNECVSFYDWKYSRRLIIWKKSKIKELKKNE